MSDHIDGDILAFSIDFGVRGSSCLEQGHDRCGYLHKVADGTATLTVSGSAAAVRRAATLVFPHLAKADARVRSTCAACGASSADGIPIHEGRCPECIADGWTPLEPPQPGDDIHLSHRSARVSGTLTTRCVQCGENTYDHTTGTTKAGAAPCEPKEPG